MPYALLSARPPRALPLVRRARRGLAGALAGLAVAASAGCSAVTGSDEVGLDDLRGSYALTHYNAVQIPGVIEEDAGGREEILAGTLDVAADNRVTMTVSERDTDKTTGQVYSYAFRYVGTAEMTGARVRITYAEEGDPEDEQVATGEFRDGVLRLTFDADDSDEVATFRKR